MKILFLNQQFQTPAGGSISRGYEFMRLMAQRGHDVTVLCSGIDTEPELAIASGKTSSVNTIDGMRCISVAAGWGSPMAITQVNKYRRMIGFLKFARVATSVGRRLARPDVIIASSPPLPIGLAGRNLARHFHVPFVFEIRDPWPQALVNLRALSNPAVIMWMRWMERRIQSAADMCIALSPPIRDGLVEQGFRANRIAMVPNACDLELFGMPVDRTKIHNQLGLGGRFTAIYFGAMGFSNGLGYILNAAQLLKDQGRNDIAILMVGTGGERDKLANRIANEKLDNVILRAPVSRYEIARYVSACDVCLTIIGPSVGSPTWSPNKLFDGLAGGKPVVVNVTGWLKELLEKNNAGRAVHPTDASELANTLVELASDPTLLETLGENARQLATNDFAREKLADRMEQALFELVHRQDRATVV